MNLEKYISVSTAKRLVPLFAHPVYIFGTIKIVDPPMLKAAPRKTVYQS